MTTPMQPKRGRLDVKSVAQVLHLPEKMVRDVFGLKSPNQIAIENAPDLMALHNLGYSTRFEDKDEKALFRKRRADLGLEVLRAHTGSLDELQTAWESLNPFFNVGERYDRLSEARDEIVLEILGDPARRPRILEFMEAALGRGYGREVTDKLHRMIDGEIERQLMEISHKMETLCEMYKSAKDLALRARIEQLIREQIRNLYGACQAYEKTYEGFSTEEESPFRNDVVNYLKQAFSKAKTANAKYKVMTSERNLANILDLVTLLPFWEEVFRAYLAEDNLDEARQLKENLFRGEIWRRVKELTEEEKRFNALYNEAYDRIHLEEVTGEKSLSELLKISARTPFGTMAYERLRVFITEKLSAEIEVATDIETLLSLSKNPRLSAEQGTRIRERKHFFLKHIYLEAKTEEDLLKFWKLLDSAERVEWTMAVIKALAPFHLIEDVADLVEISV
jgi:hypothetical protein